MPHAYRTAKEKWEVLLGIRLLGTTFGCGLSNHQAATAQMHFVGKSIVECRPLLGALRLSLAVCAPTQESLSRGSEDLAARCRFHVFLRGPHIRGALTKKKHTRQEKGDPGRRPLSSDLKVAYKWPVGWFLGSDPPFRIPLRGRASSSCRRRGMQVGKMKWNPYFDMNCLNTKVLEREQLALEEKTGWADERYSRLGISLYRPAFLVGRILALNLLNLIPGVGSLCAVPMRCCLFVLNTRISY